MLPWIRKKLFFLYGMSKEDSQRIRAQIRRDNRKFTVVWSSAELFYWTYCFIMSFFNEAFTRCRNAYIAAFFLSLAALFIAVLLAPRKPRLVFPAALLAEASLLSAGVWISLYQLQYSGATIVLFASVLIVPIMFVSEDLSNLLVILADIVVFSFLLFPHLDAETYHWNHTNLIIFSTIGLLLGHFVNKARFERYRFADAASKLADLQTRYAYQDPMTGLGNRRAYSEKIDGLAAALPADCWFVMADINGLKAANDTLGHEAGDELIVGAAECLRQSFPGVDGIYRIGGDEFCIIARGDTAEAEEGLKRLETVSAAWKGRFIDRIALSCGLASVREFPDLASLLKAADQRMYEAKRNYYILSGKDRRRR